MVRVGLHLWRGGWVDSREDNSGDVFVDEFVILKFWRTKETVGKPSSSSNGDGGQEPFAGNVSDRCDARNVGGLVLVDVDVTLVSCLYTNFL